MDKVCKVFGRWGFGAIAIPALLPPPLPMVPFLLAAGAMQYPAKKFLAAFTVGRTSRYLILTYVAARYGRQIIAAHAHPALMAVLTVLIAATAVVLYFWRGKKSSKWTWKLGERFF
jgi:membrane protein DedA with SNARE-associated domain